MQFLIIWLKASILGFLINNICGENIWFGPLTTKLKVDDWPTRIAPEYRKLQKFDDSQVTILKGESPLWINHSDWHELQDDGIPLSPVATISESNNHESERNSDDSNRNIQQPEGYQQQHQFQTDSEADRQHSKDVQNQDIKRLANEDNQESDKQERSRDGFRNENENWVNEKQNGQTESQEYSDSNGEKGTEDLLDQNDHLSVENKANVQKWWLTENKQSVKEDWTDARKDSENRIIEDDNLNFRKQRPEDELEMNQDHINTREDTRTNSESGVAQKNNPNTKYPEHKWTFKQKELDEKDETDARKQDEGWVAHESNLNPQNQEPGIGYSTWNVDQNQENTREDRTFIKKLPEDWVAQESNLKVEDRRTDHGQETDAQKHSGDWSIQQHHLNIENPGLGNDPEGEQNTKSIREDGTSNMKRADEWDGHESALNTESQRLRYNENVDLNQQNSRENRLGTEKRSEDWIVQEDNLDFENQGRGYEWNAQKNQQNVEADLANAQRYTGDPAEENNNFNVINPGPGSEGKNEENRYNIREEWTDTGKQAEGWFVPEQNFNVENQDNKRNVERYQPNLKNDFADSSRSTGGRIAQGDKWNAENQGLEYGRKAEQNQLNLRNDLTGNPKHTDGWIAQGDRLNIEKQESGNGWKTEEIQQNLREDWTDDRRHTDRWAAEEGNAIPQKQGIGLKWNAGDSQMKNIGDDWIDTDKRAGHWSPQEDNLNFENPEVRDGWHDERNQQNMKEGWKNTGGWTGEEGNSGTENQRLGQEWNTDHNQQNIREDRQDSGHSSGGWIADGNFNPENQNAVENHYEADRKYTGPGTAQTDGINTGFPRRDTTPPSTFINQIPQGNYKGEDGTIYSGENDGGTIENSIAGTPGVDYPIYSSLPETEFDCKKQGSSGYFADTETRCQVYHVCQDDGRHNSFLCPTGTIFNQQLFTCDWWYNYDCSQSANFYSLNADFYKQADPQGNFKGHDYPRGVGLPQQPNQQYQPKPVGTLRGDDDGLIPRGFDNNNWMPNVDAPPSLGEQPWKQQNAQAWNGAEESKRNHESNHQNAVKNQYNSFHPREAPNVNYGHAANSGTRAVGETYENHQSQNHQSHDGQSAINTDGIWENPEVNANNDASNYRIPLESLEVVPVDANSFAKEVGGHGIRLDQVIDHTKPFQDFYRASGSAPKIHRSTLGGDARKSELASEGSSQDEEDQFDILMEETERSKLRNVHPVDLPIRKSASRGNKKLVAYKALVSGSRLQGHGVKSERYSSQPKENTRYSSSEEQIARKRNSKRYQNR